MENTKTYKQYKDKYHIIVKDLDLYLVSKALENNNTRLVISFIDNEEDRITIGAYKVQDLYSQDEEIINYMLEYEFSNNEIEQVKEKHRKDLQRYSIDNISMYIELANHKYANQIYDNIIINKAYESVSNDLEILDNDVIITYLKDIFKNK